MKELGIKKSFIISLSGHLLFLLIFTFVMASGIKNEDKDLVTVSLEPIGESISKGLGDNIYEPAEKPMPRLTDKKTLPEANKTIPEKTLPEKENESVKNIPGATGEDLAKETHNSKTDTANLNNISNSISQEENKQQEIKKLFGDIEKALEQGGSSSSNEGKGAYSSGGDPLSDASWGLRPRKTTFFPDIQSKIPDKYKKKGLSYSITVILTFDKNGLASRVEIISSSGDPAIDSIFNEELRKIRVEPIDEDRIDKITKVFKISLK